MADNRRLVEAAMQLRGVEPTVWDEFVMAMREYAAATTTDMLRSPPELLMRAQGMALAANEIATVLREAPQLYEKMRSPRGERS
jgi:hypothetical protein